MNSKNRLPGSEPPMKPRVQSDLFFSQSVYSHSWERQQAAGDLGSQVMHCSLYERQHKTCVRNSRLLIYPSPNTVKLLLKLCG